DWPKPGRRCRASPAPPRAQAPRQGRPARRQITQHDATSPDTTWSPPFRPSSSNLAGLRAVMACNLRAGRLPDAAVLADVAQRCVESVDAVRHAGEIGMDRDRHDAARLRALAIEHVELPADHVAELIGGPVEFLKSRLVVDLVAIGHADQRFAAVERHDVGLIVVGPVADVIASFGGEVIERVPGLLQAGAEPAARPRAGRLLDGRKRTLDDARLFAGRRGVEAARIAFAMPHPFPA